MWQAEADTELTLSASPTTAVDQILLIMAKFCQITASTAVNNKSYGEPCRQIIAKYGIYTDSIKSIQWIKGTKGYFRLQKLKYQYFYSRLQSTHIVQNMFPRILAGRINKFLAWHKFLNLVSFTSPIFAITCKIPTLFQCRYSHKMYAASYYSSSQPTLFYFNHFHYIAAVQQFLPSCIVLKSITSLLTFNDPLCTALKSYLKTCLMWNYDISSTLHTNQL